MAPLAFSRNPKMWCQGADSTCDACKAEILAISPRRRCQRTQCDDIHLCTSCGITCPQCSACMYRDDASPYVLRARCFRESFESNNIDSSTVVHPREMVRRAFVTYAERPLLGEPCNDGSVHWFNYHDCGIATQTFASELYQSCAIFNPDRVAILICATNSVGWLISDWACTLAGLPSIAADSSVDANSVFLSAQEAAKIVGRVIGAVIVDAACEDEWQELLSETDISIFTTMYSRNLLVKEQTKVALSSPLRNKIADFTKTNTLVETTGNDLVTCLFSFGSTGKPKPIWFDSNRWASWGEQNPPISRRGRLALARRSIRVSCAALFAPLSHALARRTSWGELLHGGRLGLCNTRGVCYSNSNISNNSETNPRGTSDRKSDNKCREIDILDQIFAIAPTTLSAAPRFYSLYQRRYEIELHNLCKESKTVEKATTTAFGIIRRLGGSRLRLVAIGGAVVPPPLLDFLRKCFGKGGKGGGNAVVSNGYAMTEIGGITRDGVPLKGVHIKLLKHKYRDDLGEILVKKPLQNGGTDAVVLDAAGWFHTGDLGRWIVRPGNENEPERKLLEVCERVSFTVKLDNGEFFSPQTVEWVYEEHCPSIESCVLIARPGDVKPIAIVIVANTSISTVKQNEVSVKTTADVARKIIREMRLAASEAGLRSWECPDRVSIDSGPWDEASGCCSSHGKLRRNVIASRHPGIITTMTTSTVNSSISNNIDHGSNDVVERILAFLVAETDKEAIKLLPEALVNSNELDPGEWWTLLGGDSIAATLLVAAWDQQYIRNSTSMSIERISVRDIYALLPWDLRRKAQFYIHSFKNDTVQAIEQSNFDKSDAHCIPKTESTKTESTIFWKEEVSFDVAWQALQKVPVEKVCVSNNEVKTTVKSPCILLTGATGFLGPHLLDAILNNSWNTIVVLTRSPLDRICKSCATNEAKKSGRLLVFEYDLSKPQLGLSTSDFSTIQAMHFGAVLHSGASVDHARPYNSLRATNVASVAALVDLISPSSSRAINVNKNNNYISKYTKPLVVFVSTMSVIPVAAAAKVADWRDPVDSLVPSSCAMSLGSGYARSKMVAEHLFAAAAARGKIQLVIVRLGLIGPPVSSKQNMNSSFECNENISHYTPRSERRDWLSLLLSAVEVTGASPAGLTSKKRSVGVLPVNIAAAALVAEASNVLSDSTESNKNGIRDDTKTKIIHFDAAHFGIPPKLLSSLLDEIEVARGKDAPPLQREMPYGNWRRLVASAGPPAVLALTMLPAESRGGALRLPSGARRRLREISKSNQH